MTYQTVIFDLDGTLLNTLDDLADSMNRVLARAGLPTHPVAAYRYFVGDGAKKLVMRALPESHRTSEQMQPYLRDFLDDYGQHWNVKTRPYTGIPALLDALTARGVAMAVLTNKPHVMAQNCVAELLPNYDFEVVLGQRDELPRKPDPAGALEIARRLGRSPVEILYLGDTAVDMQTALAAGMPPVGVLWGFRTAEELEAHGAHRLLQQPAELLPLLDT